MRVVSSILAMIVSASVYAGDLTSIKHVNETRAACNDNVKYYGIEASNILDIGEVGNGILIISAHFGWSAEHNHGASFSISYNGKILKSVDSAKSHSTRNGAVDIDSMTVKVQKSNGNKIVIMKSGYGEIYSQSISAVLIHDNSECGE